MSRVGKQPIILPSQVNVTLEGRTVKVEGPLGRLSYTIPHQLNIQIKDREVHVVRNSDERQVKALHGLTRSLINNMVIGVSQGYKKTLEIVGVGYKAEVKGNKLILNLGYSHPIEYPIPEGIKIKVEKQLITVEGADKYLVGQTAANIRSFRKPDVYKGKGIKYTDEIIRKKAGKTGAK